MLLVVGEIPAGHPAAELGRRVRDEDGYAVPVEERVGVVRVEWRRTGDHRADAREVVAIEIRVEHHAQRRRHEAHGAGAVTADRVDPLVDAEALKQAERATVVHALQEAEQPAEVHHRRVHDRHAAAQPNLDVGVALVVLGAVEHAGEGLVGERHALGRTRRAAREHLDRHSGRAARSVDRRVAVHGDGTELVAGEPPHLGRAALEVVGLAGDGRDVERLEVGEHPLHAAVRVRGDHAGSGAQQPEHQADLRWTVAEQDRDALARLDEWRDRIGGGAEVAPGVPSMVELERVGGRVEREHLGDPFRECRQPAPHQRSLGSGRSGPRSATSALPIGLPSRV